MQKKLLSLLFIPFLIFSCGPISTNPDPKPDPDPEADYWPTPSINTFLSSKGISGVTIPSIKLTNQNDLASCQEEMQDNYTYLNIIINGNRTSEYLTALTSGGFTLTDGYYKDANDKVSITVEGEYATYISIFDSKDIKVVPPPEPDPDPDPDIHKVSYALYDDIFGKVQANTLGPVIKTEGLVFTADYNGAANKPNSTNNDGKKLILYQDNTLNISGKDIRTIKYLFNNEKTPSITANTGSLSNLDVSDNSITWTGAANSVTITAVSQSRLVSVDITYYEKKVDPTPGEIKTVEEVYEMASKITHPDVEWYLTNQEVTVEVEAIDAIDSVATGGNLDGDARGKSLVVDETGYIICSSGVSKNNPISFYQRVKDYIKAGTTQYRVSGKIAFFNGVVEIKVSNYSYDPSIEIDKDFDEYVESTFTTSEAFVNDVVNNTTPNSKGYGVHHVVKMEGLTYFNKYNSAGSYYFLDQQGMIVPVYSLLDKDRAKLSEGHCYDIVGLESLYVNRPSLRILDVTASEEDSTTFNFDENVQEISDLSIFYNIGQSRSEQYVKSELTVYKADVYVSQYAADKYTFNTTFKYDLATKEYTTGSTQINAANQKSLGIFNENLDYKQTLLDFCINNCRSEEEVLTKKVTLYFTLANLSKVDSKNYWRVNIFEDLVFSYEYYMAPKQEMIFDTTKSTCTYEEHVYQTWMKDGLSLKNESTDVATISRQVEWLKIVDGTKVTIEFTSNILGFTLYHSSFSRPFSLEGVDIRAYRLYGSYTEILLAEPTNKIEITDFAVSGETYLRVSKMEIKYQANAL